MLALDDAALARICIGASRIPRGQRRRWLRKIADELDGEPRQASGMPPAKRTTGSVSARARGSIGSNSPTG